MSGGGPTIRQLVDEARETYRETVGGRMTADEVLAEREMERDLEQDERDRHGPVDADS